MVDDEEREELIDLSEDEDDSPEQIQGLKEKLDNIYADEATAFMDKKEERDLENAIITRATAKGLKERTSRVYEIKLIIDQQPTGEFKEEIDDYGIKRKVEIKRPIVEIYKVKLPTDADKLGLQSLGINTTDDMRKPLSPKQQAKADLEQAKFLSKCVLDPKLTAKEWSEDVPHNIFQNLLFRLMSASVVTDEALLIDFFTNV